MSQKLFSDGEYEFSVVDEDNVSLAQEVLNHNPFYHTSIVYTKPDGLARRCMETPPPPVEGARVFKKFLLISQGGRPVAVLDLFAGFPNYKTASIALFMVHDAWHRKGVATSVLTGSLPRLLREFHPAVETISVSLTDNNVPALRCLLKCRYERTNSWSKLDASGKTVTAVTFKKKVAEALSESKA